MLSATALVAQICGLIELFAVFSAPGSVESHFYTRPSNKPYLQILQTLAASLGKDNVLCSFYVHWEEQRLKKTGEE